MKRFVLVVCALFVVTGCGKIREKLAEKAAEKAIEKSSSGEVDLSSSSGSIKIKDEKTGGTAQFGNGAQIPDDWPSSKLPVYPGAEAFMAASTPNGKSVTLKSKDDPKTIFAFYKSKVSMKKTGEVDINNMKTLAFEDHGAHASVTINPDSSSKETMISLSYSPASN